MQEFMNLLEEKYELYLYYGSRMNSGRDSKCIAIEVKNPEKEIRNLKKIARKRKIQMPEVSFMDIKEDKYIVSWAVEEE
jgi:hypothetical protein